MNRLTRDQKGRLVREAWIEWAKKQPNCKTSWLVPYDELYEPDREVDRLIGERLFDAGYGEGERDTVENFTKGSNHGE